MMLCICVHEAWPNVAKLGTKWPSKHVQMLVCFVNYSQSSLIFVLMTLKWHICACDFHICKNLLGDQVHQMCIFSR